MKTSTELNIGDRVVSTDEYNRFFPPATGRVTGLARLNGEPGIRVLRKGVTHPETFARCFWRLAPEQDQ